MFALPEPTRFTEKEYLALEGASDIKHEFVDGYIFAMAGAKESHIIIVSNLSGSIYGQLRGRSCIVYGSDLRVRVESSRNYFYPDLTIVCGERKLAGDQTAATLLNPTVIIEVLSESTKNYDRIKKSADYRSIPSLTDYVLVAQDKPHVECFSRGDNDTWILKTAQGLDATITLPSIDVMLTLAEVYENITFEE